MPVKMRLVLGLALGLAFFGCVGLPRRRPPTEGVSPAAARRDHISAPHLSIPAEPQPVAEETPAPASVAVPVSERPLIPPRRVERAAGEIAPEPPPATSDAPRVLYEAAKQQYDVIDSYHVLLTRREVVRGKAQPEERLLFRFRKQPYSVYMKWIGRVGEGREATFVQGKYEGKLHTRLAAGDMPLMPAGKRLALAPDSVFIRNASRHAITEAGVGSLLRQLGRLLETSPTAITYLGKQKRDEFSQPLEAIQWAIAPKVEEALPRGGHRWCFFDPENHLPTLIVTQDERGKEVEYYRYERWGLGANLDDDDFDPDKLWSQPAPATNR